ncbi:hypothetical protein [Modestobacter roseus]|uniref:Uncharacterized protein n=1 Tax=Modestobacter roseus TaxID=1181884 RepID=A0A562IWH4_9ACTN|nr:hypothetical protein [Modestobacter roseus]MQA33411.1 hypothetical protein [Modestobacter roseus]TWH75328.1 hypothetical protein JD78_03884 [Modestobacter roseus]
MTWWAWLLIGWAGTIGLVAPFLGRTLRRIDAIEWTVPATDEPAPAPAARPAPARAPAAGDLVA